MEPQPRRIAVLGSPGSGKTTFALRAADALGLPVVHLDAFYWQAGWVPAEDAEFQSRHDEAIAGERWILDGNYTSSGLDRRLARADAIVLLDAPRATCLRRIVRRSVVGYGRTRAGMAPGCRERIDPGFLVWVWRWHSLHPDFEADLRRRAEGTRFAVLRSTADADGFLAGARQAPAATRSLR